MSEKIKPTHYCSFCGKSNFEVAQMIAGDTAEITGRLKAVRWNDLLEG